jgi:2-keto-4-pentenoate hydratase/2-oxohepta-3-ene-1,7-dioic acid hydratase in catechol pathway
MRLLRYGEAGSELPGVLDAEGRIRDLSSIVPDITGATLSPASLEAMRGVAMSALPLVEDNPRIGACVGGVGKFICIGLNYSDHAAESRMELPEEPVVFMKATSAICGPCDNILLPRGSLKTDWRPCRTSPVIAS